MAALLVHSYIHRRQMPVSTNRVRNFDSSVTRFCNFFEQKQGLVEKLKHRNKINQLLKVSKINYYTAYFRQSQGNSKKKCGTE